jgi:uncharacterized protein
LGALAPFASRRLRRMSWPARLVLVSMIFAFNMAFVAFSRGLTDIGRFSADLGFKHFVIMAYATALGIFVLVFFGGVAITLFPTIGAVINRFRLRTPRPQTSLESSLNSYTLPQDVFSEGRRSFIKKLTALSFGGCSVVAAYGMKEASSPAEELRFEFSWPGLKKSANPLRLIHITDLHYGWFFGREALRGLVKKLNTIEGDALLITGDVFHAPFAAVESAIDILSGLIKRKYGAFAVLGNHDYFVGAKRVKYCLSQSSITHLSDDFVIFNHEGSEICLAGLDDVLQTWSFEQDGQIVDDLAQRIPASSDLKILLCHRPSILPLAAKAGFHLTLTGHVHGGQMLIPIPGMGYLSPAHLISDYSYGWYAKDQCTMYLNKGIGSIYVPWRINCPPEIAIFSLVSA